MNQTPENSNKPQVKPILLFLVLLFLHLLIIQTMVQNSQTEEARTFIEILYRNFTSLGIAFLISIPASALISAKMNK